MSHPIPPLPKGAMAAILWHKVHALEEHGGEPGPHTHDIGSVDGLQEVLNGKQPSGNYASASHGHSIGDISALQGALDAKAATGHSHAISNVTGLQGALDGKQGAGSYEAGGAVAAHVAASDPHPQYLTQPEGDSRYSPIGGGSDSWTHIKTTADFTNATATFTTITGLTFTPAANSDWTLEARLLVWTTAIANLPRVGVNIAAGATAGMGGVNIWQAGATAAASVHANGAWNNPGAAVNVQIAAGGVLTASVPYLCEITAAGRSGAAPTAISLQMACETAGANICFIKRGSFLRHRTI